MSETIQQDIAIMNMLEKSVLQILKKNGLLQGNKTFGVVTEILNDKSLMVEITQSNNIEMVRCSPNIKFNVGDRVLIEYINNNPHDRFVLALISGSVSTESGNQDDSDSKDYLLLPYEPVEIIRDETTKKAYKFIYGYDNPETTWEQELVRGTDNKVEEIIHRYPNGVVLIRALFRNEDGKVFKYE